MDKLQAASYIAGITDGEGYIGVGSGKKAHRRIVIANTELTIISACERALAILGISYKVRCQKRTGNWNDSYTVCITRRSDILLFAEYIPLQSGAKKQRLWEILHSYKRPKLSSRCIARIWGKTPTWQETAKNYYLAAMIDGEGCINEYHRTLKPGQVGGKIIRQANVVNTDRGLIERCHEAFGELGIRSKISCDATKQKKKTLDCWKVKVFDVVSFQKMARLIPLQCTRKMDTLKHMIANVTRRPILRENLNHDLIRVLYTEEMMSFDQIADAVGCIKQTVMNSLRKSGIDLPLKRRKKKCLTS